jgi:3-keto-disaccharide hydrolase
MTRPISRSLRVALGLVGAFTIQAHAQMAREGKLLFKDDFKTPTNYTSRPQSVADGWTVQIAHSSWKQTRDGVESTFPGGHMPVLQFDTAQPFSNVVIEVEFRFHRDGTNGPNKGAACRISATNPTLDPRAYSASIWANLDSRDRKSGLTVEHDEWRANGITTVDRQPLALKSDKWYRVRMELIGTNVLTSCNGATAFGSFEKFGLPKTTIALGSGYCVHEFRKFRVYEAKPNPKWTMPSAVTRSVP